MSTDPSTDAIFENQYIRIVPTNKTLSPENNRLRLTVEIFNNTNDAISIGYIKFNDIEVVSPEDEALKFDVSGLGSHDLSVSGPQNYVLIEHEASIIATFEVWTHRRTSFKANQLLISGDLTLHNGNWRDNEYFAFQLPNIDVYD